MLNLTLSYQIINQYGSGTAEVGSQKSEVKKASSLAFRPQYRQMSLKNP